MQREFKRGSRVGLLTIMIATLEIDLSDSDPEKVSWTFDSELSENCLSTLYERTLQHNHQTILIKSQISASSEVGRFVTLKIPRLTHSQLTGNDSPTRDLTPTLQLYLGAMVDG